MWSARREFIPWNVKSFGYSVKDHYFVRFQNGGRNIIMNASEAIFFSQIFWFAKTCFIHFKAYFHILSTFRTSCLSGFKYIKIVRIQSNIQEELFAKLVNGFQPLIIFVKSSILDFWLGSECACVTILLGVMYQQRLSLL